MWVLAGNGKRSVSGGVHLQCAGGTLLAESLLKSL